MNRRNPNNNNNSGGGTKRKVTFAFFSMIAVLYVYRLYIRLNDSWAVVDNELVEEQQQGLLVNAGTNLNDEAYLDLGFDPRNRKAYNVFDPWQSISKGDVVKNLYTYYCNKSDGEDYRVVKWAADAYADHLSKKYPDIEFRSTLRLFDEKSYEPGFQSFIFGSKHIHSPHCKITDPKIMQHLKSGRLQIIGKAGEVFAGPANCPLREGQAKWLLLDRSLERKVAGCDRIHFLQGLQFVVRGNGNYNIHGLCAVTSKSRQELEANIKKRPGAALLTTAKVIKRSYHPGDALVRGAVFSLLTEKLGKDVVHGAMFLRDFKGSSKYHHVKCGGVDLDSTVCKRNYKFSIDMENTSEDGYVSEKVFTGLIAGTVPIYFGAPEIGEYINLERIIHCPLNRTVVQDLRKKKKGKQFFFNPDRTDNLPMPEVLEQATEYLRPHLEQCIDKVAKINANDDLYYEKLMQQPFTDQRLVCSQFPMNFDVGQQIFDAFESRPSNDEWQKPSESLLTL